MKPRLLRICGIVLGSIALDQMTKVIAIQKFRGMSPIVFWKDLFRFEYAENQGAFLNLGASLPISFRFWILSIAVGFFLAMLFVFLLRNPRIGRFQTLALSLVLGGGISNLLDRLFRPGGRVVDFMNTGLGSLRTGIFNVADVFILFGIIGFLILSFTQDDRTKRPRRA